MTTTTRQTPAASAISNQLNNTDYHPTDHPHCITNPMLVNHCQPDEQYQLLATTVETGFQNTR